MKRTAQSVLLLLTGAAILRVSLFSDIGLRYVKEGLRPYLILAGSVLVLAGLAGVVRDGLPAARRSHPAGPPGHRTTGPGGEHEHTRGPRIAWLLLPPALVLLFFAPPALGSYTAARDNPKIVADYDHFDPLPAQGPVALSLTEFIARVQQDGRRTLRGRTVVLEGFVTPGKHRDWKLSRLVVSCCAADAQSLTLTLRGAPAPPADSWVKVTGSWHPYGTLGTATAALALDVATVQRIPEPRRPYRDTPPALG